MTTIVIVFYKLLELFRKAISLSISLFNTTRIR